MRRNSIRRRVSHTSRRALTALSGFSGKNHLANMISSKMSQRRQERGPWLSIEKQAGFMLPLRSLVRDQLPLPRIRGRGPLFFRGRFRFWLSGSSRASLTETAPAETWERQSGDTRSRAIPTDASSSDSYRLLHASLSKPHTALAPPRYPRRDEWV